jgi:hypothetical protein
MDLELKGKVAIVGGGSMAAIDARIQDELFTNYYLNEAVDVAEAGATEEDQVFRDCHR